MTATERVMRYVVPQSMPKVGRWALLAVLCGIAPAAHAQDLGFRLVVNEANPVTTLKREDLGRIFLKKTTKWEHGMTIQPVDQASGARVRARFSEEMHGRSASAIVSYWQQQIFSGRGVPPVEKQSDAEVVEYVRSHPGAIGYVTPGAATGGVRVVEIVRVVEVR